MAFLLAITPLLILSVPRIMAWWPAVLGLVAFSCADKDKQPLWLTACVPLWIATLALISTIWAAFPYDTFEHAMDRLPLYGGLSLAILGLSRVRAEIWTRVLPLMAYGVAGAVTIVAIDHFTGHPIIHLYNTLNGEPDRFVRPAAGNRVLTGAVMMVIPALWTLWHLHKKYLATAVFVILGATLLRSEASAATLALMAGMAVFAVSLWRASFVWYAALIAGFAMLIFMPDIAHFVFHNRPDWDYLNSPSNGGRLEIWSVLSDMIAQRSWLGYGYEATRYFPMPDGMMFFKEPSVLHPHNAIMQIWVEFGALGILCALPLWKAALTRTRSAPSLAFVAITCVIALLSFGLWQGTWIGLVLFCAFYWNAAASAFGTRIK